MVEGELAANASLVAVLAIALAPGRPFHVEAEHQYALDRLIQNINHPSADLSSMLGPLQRSNAQGTRLFP